jgi:predicted metal-binding protein
MPDVCKQCRISMARRTSAALTIDARSAALSSPLSLRFCRSVNA